MCVCLGCLDWSLASPPTVDLRVLSGSMRGLDGHRALGQLWFISQLWAKAEPQEDRIQAWVDRKHYSCLCLYYLKGYCLLTDLCAGMSRDEFFAREDYILINFFVGFFFFSIFSIKNIQWKSTESNQPRALEPNTRINKFRCASHAFFNNKTLKMWLNLPSLPLSSQSAPSFPEGATIMKLS